MIASKRALILKAYMEKPTHDIYIRYLHCREGRRMSRTYNGLFKRLCGIYEERVYPHRLRQDISDVCRPRPPSIPR